LRVAAACKEVLLGDGDGGPSMLCILVGSMLREDMIFGCTLDSVVDVVDVVVCGESEFRSGAISGSKLIKKLECGFFEAWGNFQRESPGRLRRGDSVQLERRNSPQPSRWPVVVTG
jgi:hypothetical protein